MKDREKKTFFWRWGRFIFRLRWLVLLLSVVVFLGMGYYARQVPELLKDNGFAPRGSESDVGFTLLQDKLDFPASAITLVYSSDTMNLRSGLSVSAILSSLDNLRKLSYVRSVKVNDTPRLNKNSGLQSVHIELALSKTEALDKYPEIRSKVRPPAGMHVFVDGPTATLYDIQQATKNDLSKSERLGLPIALFVLLLIFGSLLAAVMPLIIGIMSVSVTLGACFFIAQRYSLSNFTPNMVTMVGLAVGIDYALFVVSRFREELVRQRAVSTAVARTCEMAGRSIVFSGFAVLIGMLGLLFINLPVMRSICLGGVLVVLTSVTFSNTLLLALLSIFGHKINRFQIFPALQKKRHNSTLWERIAFSVMKRPVFLVLVISGMLILLMLPIGGMKLAVPTAEVLPPTYESRQGSDLLKETYDAREANPIHIVVHTPGVVWDKQSIRDINDYTNTIRTYPGVHKVRSFITMLGNHPPGVTAAMVSSDPSKRRIEEMRLAKDHTALVVVVPDADPDSASTAGLIRKLRKADTGALQTYVTGASANRVDILDRIDHGLPAMVGFVMAITYMVLFAAFRSIILPLKAVLMNILSLGASLGIVVIVFQKGILANLLNITSVGYVSIVLPVTIFCVVFGISMDYEVFLLSRIKEEYEKTGDNERSTATGLMKTGGLITSAAFILIVVVGSFIFTDIEITKALGVGLFSAIFIDATFIRVIFVPALMKLLGRANWWAPAWSR
ncbi:MMPL family transporter [Cohnella pontilimi]|uniref:MMPL family transporter n=1 Tax=Cohnella pontilimi TaxID=2564100 RepID=A0A4U0F1Y4_9BACL|nr:MMPL family transporter [Cohnella pontilimi]TJY38258.1 MMPL family transporter [Cohnella pontilimi]